MCKKIVNKKLFKRLLGWGIVIAITIPPLVVFIKNIATASHTQVQQFFTPTKVTYTINNIYGDRLHTEIQEFIAQATTQKSLLTFKPDLFYQELKQAFPMVKKLTWHFAPPQTLELTIIGTTPYCLVNNEFILGDKKRLLSRDFFTNTPIHTLPQITINQQWIIDNKLDENVYTFVHNIKPDSWNSYQITYHSPTNIRLVPCKALCRCTIITDEKTFFNQKKYNYLGSVFLELCKKGLITNKTMLCKNIPLVFDMRIKNQIIVKGTWQATRGRGYEQENYRRTGYSY